MSVIAILSPTGFIGRQLAAELLQRGNRVRGLARRRMDVPADWQDRFSLHQVDFATQVEVLRENLRGASAVVHCAGHYEADERGLQDYVVSVERLSCAAGQAGVERFILLSSVAVYGQHRHGWISIDTPPAPDSAYGRSRLEAERRAAATLAGTPVGLIVVRVPAVIGSGMRATVLNRFFGGLRTGWFLHPGGRMAVFPCIGVHRLAVALALLSSRDLPGLPSLMQLSDTLTWREIADIYGRKAYGRSPRRIALPAVMMQALTWPFGARLQDAFKVLANTTSYEDLSPVLDSIDELPDTRRDLEEMVEQMHPACANDAVSGNGQGV